MSDRQLTTGEPVPEDESHRELRADGQQKGYVVLTPAERAKGFVKPVRSSYIHEKCGSLTSMGNALSETYARNPRFYSGTFCCACGSHYDLQEFHWTDGEPMHPDLQEAWHIAQETLKGIRERKAAEELQLKERAELARLKAKYEPSGGSTNDYFIDND